MVGKQKLALETHRHANSDICYNMNALPTVNVPLWFIVPQVVITVRNSILVWKGTKGKKGQGYLLEITLPLPLHNKAHTLHYIAHTQTSTHQKFISLHECLPQTSINALLPLSEKQTHILHQNISNDIFRVWKRISIHQILQRLKLQRRVFDIWSPSLAWPLQQFTKHI